MRKMLMRALPAAGALAGAMVLAPGMASAAVGVSVLNLAIPGPVVASQTCLNGNCVNLQGVSDVQVSASVKLNTLGVPLVSLGRAQGCSSLVNVQATVRPGTTSGTISVTISYDRTNAHGAVIPGSRTSVTNSVALTAGGPPVTVSECASAG